jgi:hypothetical protein
VTSNKPKKPSQNVYDGSINQRENIRTSQSGILSNSKVNPRKANNSELSIIKVYKHR